MARDDANAIGQRLKAFRHEKGLTATQLAKEAGISRSYLSELESGAGNHQRPSGRVLYALGQALGVAMSDLLGRPLILETTTKPPASLLEFAEQEGLARSDIEMLASIKFRGDAPQTTERWRFIYQAIRNSTSMDTPQGRRS
jgi:transcriptional regulator with XRE-family HTH domain